jgi:hypothetical protein
MPLQAGKLRHETEGLCAMGFIRSLSGGTDRPHCESEAQGNVLCGSRNKLAIGEDQRYDVAFLRLLGVMREATMNRTALGLTLLFACTLMFPQADRSELIVSSFDDVQHGMPMKDVAEALRKHGYNVKETTGMLAVQKGGRSIGWALGGGRPQTENIVNSITYQYEPLDFAVALHNEAQRAGTVVDSPSWQHETSTQMTVRVIDSSEKDGQNQFVDLSPSKGTGMYRIVIRRRSQGDPTVDFQFVR